MQFQFQKELPANEDPDFSQVDHWEQNKLDRTQSSRMGWSDVALCLSGPAVQDLRTHFSQRWNFIYDEKYSKKSSRYERLPDTYSGAQQAPQRGVDDGEDGQRGLGGDENEDRGLFGQGGHGGGGFRHKLLSRVSEGYQHYGQGHQNDQQSYQQGSQQSHAEHSAQRASVDCQITRSSAKWSHNISIEVSTSSKHQTYN